MVDFALQLVLVLVTLCLCKTVIRIVPVGRVVSRILIGSAPVLLEVFRVQLDIVVLESPGVSERPVVTALD